MSDSVFVETTFWLLVVFSFVLPVVIYWVLLKKKAASIKTVLALGLALVFIAGIDVFLLQRLASNARLTPSLVDDAVFASELMLALYVFPALFGGIGINILSHVLIRHLESAERKFEHEHPDP